MLETVAFLPLSPVRPGDRAEPLQPSPEGQIRVFGSVAHAERFTLSTAPLESICPSSTTNSLDQDARPKSLPVGDPLSG